MSGTDGLPVTRDAYAAYVRDRDMNGRRIAAEACSKDYEAPDSKDEDEKQSEQAPTPASSSAPPRATTYDDWVSPADHVDALASPAVRRKMTDLLEQAFNMVAMPGKLKRTMSGGTTEIDYGKSVTLGKQPYTDVFKGKTFKSKKAKWSLKKENCCVRACGAKTG